MDKRVALVTGASRGVGKSICDILLADGYFVEGCSRSPGVIPDNAYCHTQLDIGNAEGVKDWIQSVQRRHGRIDVVVNNAGIYRAAPVLIMSPEIAEEVMRVNFLGTFYVCREAARAMKRNRYGRIINISSIAVTLKDESTAVYTASKSAVTSFSQVLARELAPFGITCNVIELSIFQSQITENLPQNVRNRVVDRLTVKRYAKQSDIRNALHYVTGADSDYVSGQVLKLGFSD